MSTSAQLLHDLAQLYVTNETEGGIYGSLAEVAPDLTMAEAYAVQAAAIKQLKERGAVSVGKKIAATNDATQAMLGLQEPAYGELLDTMVIANGGSVPAVRFANGRIECEIAFKMGEPLAGPEVTPEDVRNATEAIYAAFELADLRNQGWSLTTAEVICYDGLAKHFVLAETGIAPQGVDMAGLTVTLRNCGQEVATGVGAAALGDPLAAVAWLANKLISQGRRLEAGEIVLTGSLTPPLPMAAGDHFAADFPGLGAVSVIITD